MGDMEKRVAAIRARLQAITPGPWSKSWSPDYCAPFGGAVVIRDGTSLGGVVAMLTRLDYNESANADLIAHAPGDIAFLLELLESDAELTRLEKENEWLQGWRGKRGQAFLRELLAALDAMPVKALIVGELQDASGQVCTLGSIGVARGLDVEKLDPDDYEGLSTTFGIAEPLVREIEFENDECAQRHTPEMRWQRMRDWVASKIIEVVRVDAETQPKETDQ